MTGTKANKITESDLSMEKGTVPAMDPANQYESSLTAISSLLILCIDQKRREEIVKGEYDPVFAHIIEEC